VRPAIPGGIPGVIVGDELVPRVFTAGDLPWIDAVLTEVRAAVGRPWLELRQRLRAPAIAPPSAEARALVEDVIRRRLRGTISAAADPRRARAALFSAAARAGLPAPTDAPARAALLSEASGALGVPPAAVLASLFADLPDARLVVAPGDQDASALLAELNHEVVSRIVRRATAVRIRLLGNSRAIVLGARRRGLICEVRTTAPPDGLDDGRRELVVSGPLALFRHTRVYGGALCSLLGLLPWATELALDAAVLLGDRTVRYALRDRTLLRPAGPGPTLDSELEARFARDLRAQAPGWHLVREPAPVRVGEREVFPDFALVPRSASTPAAPSQCWWIEVVGFWTPAYLAQKRADYLRAGMPNLILCVDQRHGADDLATHAPGPVVPFRRRIDVRRVLAIVEPQAPPDHDRVAV
jgi:predicted nuclease of restriction endonuclease-like RecB superfamily